MSKMGRPKIEAKSRKAGVFSFRVSQAERKEIEDAAERGGKRATTWAREILLASARDKT